MKVFGIGLNKSASSSLIDAWDLLGHRKEIYWPEQDPQRTAVVMSAFTKNYKLLFDRVDQCTYFKDRPFNVWDIYKLLDKHYLDCKFILTVRDEEAWWDSVDRWLNNLVPGHHINEQMRLEKIDVYKHHFQCDDVSKEKFIQYYRKYNQEVRDYFKGRDNFLEMDIPAGDGWNVMCPFLNEPILDVPFPHSNKNNVGKI
jgi:hypothetical protein